MKKIFFPLLILVVSFAGSKVHAQIITKQVPVTKNTTIRTIPSQPPPPPPPPANNPPATANTAAYYLTAARVSIVTGNDNKEQPSRASISLATTDGGCWPSDRTTGGCGLYEYNFSTRILNEYKVNSVTDISLKTDYQFPYTFPGGVGDGWRYINLSLSGIQTYGLTLYVNYDPNFVLDAWKIEKLTLTLEFKDLHGNAHPTLGVVTSPFINASALLSDSNRTLKCETDKFLMPKN